MIGRNQSVRQADDEIDESLRRKQLANHDLMNNQVFLSCSEPDVRAFSFSFL